MKRLDRFSLLGERDLDGKELVDGRVRAVQDDALWTRLLLLLSLMKYRFLWGYE